MTDRRKTESDRDAYVIITNDYGFEEVVDEVLVKAGRFWFNPSQIWRNTGDIFDTELDARNELEKRLYARSENLRKHREAMSRLLVNCAPPMPNGNDDFPGLSDEALRKLADDIMDGSIS